MINDEFLRCLRELDVAGARKLWAAVHPQWYQPKTDDEMLIVLHLARLQSKAVHPRHKVYSRQWLREREDGSIAVAVGIAIGAPVHRIQRALAVRTAMEDAVECSIKAGIDIDSEANEVRYRMIIARDRELGLGRSISAYGSKTQRPGS